MLRLAFLLLLSFFVQNSFAQNLKVNGLQESVEVIRDQWGISHIYAQNEHDLFLAQGYVAASDRPFQLEMWRRQATGTVAELLGSSEVNRDIGTRLFRYRGDMEREYAHYHPRGKAIITAFVAGINARVAEMRADSTNLPFEFKLLKTLPDYWTPEVVVSRHQGLVGNVVDELNYGRQVQLIGEAKTRELNWFHPTRKRDTEPKLKLEKGVEGQDLFQDILALYTAHRSPVKFSASDKRTGNLEEEGTFDFQDWYAEARQYVGSNNWAIDGRLAQNGFPMLANDPHRIQAAPSLRYWIHLNAPGWNVIGAGEPSLPGVSIGHNDHGAWGLTVFATDNEDLYVYETNPNNPNQYRYQGKWVTMNILTDSVAVNGTSPQSVELKFTRHGPVVFEDKANHKAYAVRTGWLEVGSSPYLASLRMNQAKNWDEFREACSYSRLPGENMVWADRAGHIGWQGVGLAPIRPNWSGLVPVPGDGRFEWSGFLPIKELPHSSDPAEGFIATANNNLTSPDFPQRNAIGWEWSSPYRAQRIEEVLGSGKRFNLFDFVQLQTDYLSIPARTLVPMLARLDLADAAEKKFVEQLSNWDFQLTPEHVAASVYAEWESQLSEAIHQIMVPEAARPHLRRLSTKLLLDYLITPPAEFGTMPVQKRDEILRVSFQKAITALTQRLGKDPSRWQYGQAANKHVTIEHPLSPLASTEMRKKINFGPVPRGGSGETVNSTGNSLLQRYGASFRILVDTENWDKTLGINSPGQSGDPDDPHYGDLFQRWTKNEYFPVYFNKEKIKTVADRTLTLSPAK
ncbi:penicillin acylase family protein [Persicitalea sp.]|uniref:penicillin acylase family protein n=1 Tax=Persicitalea sp. TaxID=3100273 RepID=UPI003593916B